MNPDAPPPSVPDAPQKVSPGEPLDLAWTVERRLFDAEMVCSFDFFQAVRLLRLLFSQGRIDVGLDGPPQDEIVRFLAHLSLSFPASSIQHLSKGTAAKPAPMTINFMGLTGPNGVLPRHYTERMMIEAKGDERTGLQDWLDLFNHRFVSLFYRAWEKYRFYLPFERGESAHRDPDAFSRCLYSLIGLGFRSHRNRFQVTYSKATPKESAGVESVAGEKQLAKLDDLPFLRFSGLFAHRPRCAVSLESFLRVYLELPVAVHQFQGQWLQLSSESQTTVGIANASLGQTTLVGDRVWDIQSKIRIALGPLTYDEFLEFLPDRTADSERKRIFLLAQVVRYYVGPEIDVEFQLILRKDHVPAAQTGSKCRLGWNMWSRRQPYPHDANDSVFSVTDGPRIDRP